jgi:hypothetical protein
MSIGDPRQAIYDETRTLWVSILKISLEIDKANWKVPGSFAPELVDLVKRLKGEVERLRDLVDALYTI